LLCQAILRPNRETETLDRLAQDCYFLRPLTDDDFQAEGVGQLFQRSQAQLPFTPHQPGKLRLADARLSENLSASFSAGFDGLTDSR
jgi:hypothetical protein